MVCAYFFRLVLHYKLLLKSLTEYTNKKSSHVIRFLRNKALRIFHQDGLAQIQLIVHSFIYMCKCPENSGNLQLFRIMNVF